MIKEIIKKLENKELHLIIEDENQSFKGFAFASLPLNILENIKLIGE